MKIKRIAWNKGKKTGALSLELRKRLSSLKKGRKPKNFEEMQKKGIELMKKNHGNSTTWKIGHKGFKNSGNFINLGAKPHIAETITKNKVTALKSHYIWCSQPNNFDRVPKGCVIHHLDLNPQNNNPENLQLLDIRTHNQFHYKINKMIGNGEIKI